jgi:hypothetical protein
VQGNGGIIPLGLGGATQGSGGATQGSGGATQGSGGATQGSGGATQGSGGATQGSGGATQGSGGATQGSGGATQGSGGATQGSGGATQGSGGATQGSGGATQGSGGATGTGGNNAVKAIFLHHSTGLVVWEGGVASWFTTYNSEHNKNYLITETYFPKESPYGWNNYPYDYWNIWVNHAGASRYLEEPTLEILTQEYNVIIWKHCFPGSDLEEDTGSPDITSSTKSVENYKLQYQALKQKMHQFPSTLFVVWTGAALRESETTAARATRARDFFQWVKSTWDEPGDNIFIWDFRGLETEGGLYLLPGNAAGDSHPSSAFGTQVAPLFGKRVVDVIEGRGDSGSITGQ